jgi:hypothetical protein
MPQLSLKSSLRWTIVSPCYWVVSTKDDPSQAELLQALHRGRALHVVYSTDPPPPRLIG